MDVLYTTRVTRAQIDHLGHMNVRYYGEHARTGALGLAKSLGLVEHTERLLSQPDRYVRHHREQLVDAPLEVRGGVLDVDSGRLRIYEELVNSDSQDLAATFVLALEPVDRPSRRPVSLTQAVIDNAEARTVALPEHGRPRSISMDDDPTANAPSLETLSGRDLAMRRVRTVAAAECDADGYLHSGVLPELVWGGIPVDGREFQPFHDTPDGVRIGWATMETRGTWARLPRAGDRVQSFGAEVDIASKTTQSRHWVFDVDRAELLCTFSVVNLAFDVQGRRAVPIPEAVRERFGERLHRDLGAARQPDPTG